MSGETDPLPFHPGKFREAAEIADPGTWREGRWRRFTPRPPVARTLRGQTFWLRPGLTFTPYANPTPCTARCAFCSEELLRRDADRLSAKTLVADDDRYFAALSLALSELTGLDMGLSLSGLEATSRPTWLLRLLSTLDRPDLFRERVLYTNGSGLCVEPRLIPALVSAHIDRIDLNRCHLDDRLNQRVMRFLPGQPIRHAGNFKFLVKDLLSIGLNLRLVCILNRQSVCDLSGVEGYLEGAIQLGVRRVVFRAMSELGDLYWPNRETAWIDANRVDARVIMAQLWGTGDRAQSLRDHWKFIGLTTGYYFYNEVYEYRGIEVTLEGSSYVAHAEAIRSGVIQKLVFHSTGDLCGDWVPNAQFIGNYLTQVSEVDPHLSLHPRPSTMGEVT